VNPSISMASAPGAHAASAGSQEDVGGAPQGDQPRLVGRPLPGKLRAEQDHDRRSWSKIEHVLGSHEAGCIGAEVGRSQGDQRRYARARSGVLEREAGHEPSHAVSNAVDGRARTETVDPDDLFDEEG